MKVRGQSSPHSSDHHVAFGLAVIADALDAVHLRQLVDDLTVLSIHRWETVAPLCLFALEAKFRIHCIVISKDLIDERRVLLKPFPSPDHASADYGKGPRITARNWP